MNEIELYVHSTKGAEPTMIKIGTGALVEELLKKIREAGLCDEPVEELQIFIEDEMEPLKRGHSIERCGVKHRHHVHCHKCHRIRVEISYNGVEKSESFPPSAKVKRVLKWALNAFELKGADAENKVLRLANPPQTELLADQHIGSFAAQSRCELKLCLVPRVRYQG